VIVIYYFIIFLARALNFAILLRVIVSWLSSDPYNPIVSLIYGITEPILAPIRRVLPSMGGLDLSPLVALILIQVAQRVLLTLFTMI
jgi:YggT family protein